MWEAIASGVERGAGIRLAPGSRRVQGGGCINEAWLIDGTDVASGRTVAVFVKVNAAERLAMFETEALALEEISATGTVRVPRPLAHGVAGDRAYLALEGIVGLDTRGGPASQRELGRQLAALHRVTEPEHRFGWHRDNVIGETPQPIGWADNWAAFFAGRRLGFQLELAARDGHRFRGAERLVEAVPDLLAGHRPVPSLLHGDLWGGNAGFDGSGDPVVFDPASYYGDRETDLAFTRMFGGFGPDFYAGYGEAWPLDPGHADRIPLYNLYHVLNHAHLFGGGYVTRARGMIDSLLERL